MALAEVTYTVPDPPVQDFTVTFPFLRDSNLTVEVNGSTTGVTFSISPSKDEITVITPTLLVGQLVTIRRTTPVETSGQYVSFSDGAVLRKDDLNTAQRQLLFILQELVDAGFTGLQLDLADSKWDALGRTLKNLANPTNPQDAATKAYVTTALVTGGVLPSPTGNALKALRVDAAGAAYELAALSQEVRVLRVKSQATGPVGFASGWVLPPSGTGFTNSDQRAPLEIVSSLNPTANFSLALNTFDVTLAPGLWMIRANGHLRGLTDTAATNGTAGQLALTDTAGTVVSSGPTVITGFSVQVQDSGAAIFKTGQLSASCEVVHAANLAVATTFNLRGRASTSSHSVVADFPSYITFTKIT